MKKTLLLLPCLAVGTTALLLAPAKNSFGFSKLGGSLAVSNQRDFRVFDNFADSQTNNNTAPTAAFPGWFGAEQALWKAAVEWGSGLHGDGSGDPTQTLGDGGANFDFVFGGAASSSSSGQQIISAIPSCGGGTFAYVTGGGSAWTMIFCDNWTWSDGPNSPSGGQIDLQGVGCHEFGHSLGLGHSSVNGATMVGSTFNGFDQRAIATDDKNGIQCIYNPKDPNKVEITGVSIDLGANMITINGLNFSTEDNEVWFSDVAVTAPGTNPIVKVTGIDSPSTTQITVALPSNAGDGDVHIKSTDIGGKSLSNGWPVDLNGTPGATVEITGFNPTAVESLIPGTSQTVTINGTGFLANLTLTVDGIVVDSSQYTVEDTQTIKLDMPQVSSLGSIPVQVDISGDSSSSSLTVVAPTTPVLQIGNGEDINNNTIVSTNGLDMLWAGPPGELHFILYSSSNVGGTIPIVSLCIGNFFDDLFELTRGNVGAAGYTELNLPLSPLFAVFFFQSLTLSQGTPIPTSNCQEALFVP